MWWHGPQFLIDESTEPPRYTPIQKTHIECNASQIVPETKNFKSPNISEEKTPYTSLKRVFAYCFRFAHNCKNKQKLTDSLTHNELQNAERAIIKIIQRENYADEIKALRKNKSVKNSSSILSLSPFLDENNILRVGGRIKRADLPFDAKHQISMPNKHEITMFLIRDILEECLHGGTKLTESVVRQRFWIPQSQRTIKTVLKIVLTVFM